MDTTDAPQLMEHIHKSITFTPNDTRWVPCSARFVVTGIHPRAKGALVVRFSVLRMVLREPNARGKEGKF